MMAMTMREALLQSGLPPLEAQVLLAHALRVERAWLLARPEEPLLRAKATAFFKLAQRRRDGEPVAYLIGVREFWGLPLAVTPNVLIPRPETETVVEQALQRLPADRDVRVLDLGTGSGAIALALARERPRAHLVATDTSSAALQVARANARRLSVFNVEFVDGDWFAALPAGGAPFDVIVSNPPYIGAADLHLAQGDVRFEPISALTAGADGLDALRVIVAAAPAHLASGGSLVVEHGYDQAEDVQALFAAAGFTGLASVRDLAGIERVAAGRAA